jgi:hypothetical protein
MDIILHESDFVNDKFLVTYGNGREALFTIVDEEFSGKNNLGRVNRIVCLVRETGEDGEPGEASLCTTIVGLGDNFVGVRSEYPELRGKPMTHENMENCVVTLYE